MDPKGALEFAVEFGQGSGADPVELFLAGGADFGEFGKKVFLHGVAGGSIRGEDGAVGREAAQGGLYPKGLV